MHIGHGRGSTGHNTGTSDPKTNCILAMPISINSFIGKNTAFVVNLKITQSAPEQMMG
jgi:hypothetical protein